MQTETVIRSIGASPSMRRAPCEKPEVVFICVGTPARADGEANLVAMEQTASQIARHAQDDVVVVEKSTVPAGTADRVGPPSNERAKASGSIWHPTPSSFEEDGHPRRPRT